MTNYENSSLRDSHLADTADFHIEVVGQLKYDTYLFRPRFGLIALLLVRLTAFDNIRRELQDFLLDISPVFRRYLENIRDLKFMEKALLDTAGPKRKVQ